MRAARPKSAIDHVTHPVVVAVQVDGLDAVVECVAPVDAVVRVVNAQSVRPLQHRVVQNCKQKWIPSDPQV